MNSTRMLYDAAGKPSIENQKIANGLCWLCGNDLQTYEFAVQRSDVIRDTFVDYDKCAVPDANCLCAACAWCFSEQIKMDGREKLQRLRNYSHFVINGKWFCLSKGQKQAMQKILFDPPADDWLGIIAESGQKHIIFRAPVSHGNEICQIQFEEQRLTYTPNALHESVSLIERGLALGFSKTEIESGQYYQPRILKVGIESWNAIEQGVRAQRGGLPFKLAIFLAQKGDENG